MKDNTPPNASSKNYRFNMEKRYCPEYDRLQREFPLRMPDDEKPVIKLEYNLTQKQKDWLEHKAHELRMKIQNEYLEGYSENNNF